MINVCWIIQNFEDELQVVKNTTTNYKVQLKKILTTEEIIYFQSWYVKYP